MKVILFEGYGDYDAVEFERANIDLKEMYNDIKKGADYFEGDTFSADISAYDFDKVDPNFVKFIRNKIQQDKNQINFYIVEEDK